MHISDKLIKDIINNSLEIDCRHITLTQDTPENPKVYSGPGSIYKDSFGVIHLKLFHVNDQPQPTTIYTQLFTQPGKIIPKELYFKLSAIDVDNNEWCSDRILPSNINNISLFEPIVIKSKLSKIYCKTYHSPSVKKEEFHSLIIIPEKLSLPYDKYEEFSNGGFNLNHCIVNCDYLTITFKEHEDFTSISINSKIELHDDNLKRKIFEALNFTKGKLINNLLFSRQNIELEEITIYSSTEIKLNKELPNIIGHHTPLHFESFEKFMRKYLSTFEAPGNLFFKYWLKINRSFQGGFETGALSLTVAIEGIIKKYYLPYGAVDEVLRAKAQQAKKAIQPLKMDAQMKSRLLSLTGQIKNPTVKNAMNKLANHGVIEKTHAECWVKLRNQFAHSDEIDDSQNVQQQLIYDYFSCISVFYILFLMNIKYDGTYSTITQDGWVDKVIKFPE